LDSSYVVIGTVEYDLSNDNTIYEVTFPNRRSWEFKDSTLFHYDSLYNLVKIDTIGTVNDYSIFKKILKDDLADFGLEEAGFSLVDVQKASRSVLMKWKPPIRMKFIKEIISKKDDNNLTGLIVVDENGKEINKTFYQDYIYVKGIPVPTRVKSHFRGDKEEIYKELQFRNVSIQ